MIKNDQKDNDKKQNIKEMFDILIYEFFVSNTILCEFNNYILTMSIDFT